MQEYQRLTAAHSAAVGDLARHNIPAAQYEQLRITAEQARKATQDARDQLKRHIAEHGC